ncbi:MAG: hypothetical protein LBP54_00660, partial [Campylobacteraceae bacterium]|jgi:hypothetical protein|nr:hypothetical protein [Campylobacteraceae bacterium]
MTNGTPKNNMRPFVISPIISPVVVPPMTMNSQIIISIFLSIGEIIAQNLSTMKDILAIIMLDLSINRLIFL